MVQRRIGARVCRSFHRHGSHGGPQTRQSCVVNNLNPEPCTQRAKRTDLAITLGATAAPLLTLPLVYLFRKGEKKVSAELSPSISVHRSGAAMGVRGVF